MAFRSPSPARTETLLKKQLEPPQLLSQPTAQKRACPSESHASSPEFKENSRTYTSHARILRSIKTPKLTPACSTSNRIFDAPATSSLHASNTNSVAILPASVSTPRRKSSRSAVHFEDKSISKDGDNVPARNIFPARETITTDAPTGTPTIVREQPNKAKSVFSKGLASDTNTVSNGMPISTPGKVSIIRAAPPDGNVSQAVHHVNTFARGAQITSYAPATIESLPLRTTFDLFKYNDGSCWHCSPFTLVPINDGIVCPRLVVKPSSVLAEPMGIGHYPLGPAIAKLHCLRHSHRPMPHEAMIILDWFRKNNTIKPIDQNVTLLDPLIYGSFGIYSQDQLEGFRMAEWCWLTLVGEPLQFKDYFSGTCRLEEIFPNYDKLTITLILSFGDGQEVYWPLKRGISPFL